VGKGVVRVGGDEDGNGVDEEGGDGYDGGGNEVGGRMEMRMREGERMGKEG